MNSVFLLIVDDPRSYELHLSSSERKAAEVRVRVPLRPEFSLATAEIPGGGVLPYKRLMGMCRWMGSHFHDWIDYNGVTFLVELLEWGRTFFVFLGEENSGKQGFKNGKIRG